MKLQITELDEAMEVRENENAALDGRVEKLEQSEGMLANGISGLQARVDDISQQCKRVKEQARQLEEDMSRNTANKDELLKLKSVLDGKRSGIESSCV
jgi:chromosome segregation ATPase